MARQGSKAGCGVCNTGEPVITQKNAVDFTKLLGAVIEDTGKDKQK
jgi:hypothetical protein